MKKKLTGLLVMLLIISMSATTTFASTAHHEEADTPIPRYQIQMLHSAFYSVDLPSVGIAPMSSEYDDMQSLLYLRSLFAPVDDVIMYIIQASDFTAGTRSSEVVIEIPLDIQHEFLENIRVVITFTADGLVFSTLTFSICNDNLANLSHERALFNRQRFGFDDFVDPFNGAVSGNVTGRANYLIRDDGNVVIDAGSISVRGQVLDSRLLRSINISDSGIVNNGTRNPLIVTNYLANVIPPHGGDWPSFRGFGW